MGHKQSIRSSYETICKIQPWMVPVQLNDKQLQMELDRGACSTIISHRKFKELGTEKDRPILRAKSIKLRANGRHGLQVLGTIQVRINVKARQPAQTLSILVVPGNGPNLFGRDVLMKLRLDWREMCRVNTRLEYLLEQSKKVFTDGFGTYRGQPATFQVETSVRPHFRKARTVPYAPKHFVIQWRRRASLFPSSMLNGPHPSYSC